MLHARFFSHAHEYRFVISLEFPCDDHCCSSRLRDRRHDSHNRKIPWRFLRLYWPAWPNKLMYENIYWWQTMIRHVRVQLEPLVTFQGEGDAQNVKNVKIQKIGFLDIWHIYRCAKRFQGTYLALSDTYLIWEHEYKVYFCATNCPEFIKKLFAKP